jgi:PKD repeat protein
MPVSPEVLSIGDQVTATATTPAGSTSRFAPSLRVAGLPQADFVVVCSGAQCTFDGSASSDTNGTIQAYLWDFDGDQIVDATGAVVSHLFPGTGNFDVTLEVVDNDNLNDVAASTITIVNTNAPPTAAFSVSCQGLDCSFDASASTDDGLITAYKWDFTDDGLVDATGLTASYTFPTAGTFDVELTVTDDESVSDATIVAVTVNNSIELGEIGTTSGTQQNSGHWNSLLFNRQYQSPIVVGGPPSINGGQQLTLRMRHVQGSGAEFQFDEYDYLDGGHVPETISYLVIEGGSHVLDNGQRLDAGAVGTSSAATTVTFSSPFASPPIVFGQIVTTNDSRAAVLRIFNVSATGFSVQIHGEEANKTYGIEAVHWVAMDPGQGQLSGRPYQVGAAGGMNGVFGNVAFSASFSGTPAIVASMQTKAGTDPCALRMKNASATGFDLKVEEEQSFDAELSHINETVGFIAMPPGSILGQSIP